MLPDQLLGEVLGTLDKPKQPFQAGCHEWKESVPESLFSYGRLAVAICNISKTCSNSCHLSKPGLRRVSALIGQERLPIRLKSRE